MKKIGYTIVLSILVLYILFFPKDAIAAASRGLVLWYSKMLPTLLPFAILSTIFISSGILNNITVWLHRVISPVFPVSTAGIYPLAAGFLFGFPMGSKITAQLVEEGKMTVSEGDHLFSICNNISPVFISGFILTTSLKAPELSGITLALLYLPPLFYYILSVRMLPASKRWDTSKKNPAQQDSPLNFKIIDAGIMSGFETLTKLGGYIMLFAIFSQITLSIPGLPSQLRCILAGLMEITNGIDVTAKASLSFQEKYLLAVGLTAFGGLSGLAQTASMVKAAGFSMGRYLKEKILCSICSLVLAYCYLNFFLL